MNDKAAEKFVFHDEFRRIFESFKIESEVRCTDLHSIQLALTNITNAKEVKIPSIYISYFLKQTPTEFYNDFIEHAKSNIDVMLGRINNYFAQNILHSAEEHLIEGLILLRTIQCQTSISIPVKNLMEQIESERTKNRTFGMIENEVKDLVSKSGNDIIPIDSPYYSYLKNYVTLRNCLTHRGGKITEKEVDLEIRLPYVSAEQIEEVKKTKSTNPITPQTVLRKWELNEVINLNLPEVEGIAYGLLKTIFQIFKHMHKAADKHVELLEKQTPNGKM